MAIKRLSRAEEPAPARQPSEEYLAAKKRRAATVSLSGTDRGTLVSLMKEGTIATCSKGFSSVRVSHGVSEGTWYCEFELADDMKKDAHVRVGWSTSRADMAAPVGANKYGYGFRDVNGAKVHDGVRNYYGIPFGDGDVVGCMIKLSPRNVEAAPVPVALPSTTSQVPTAPTSAFVTLLPSTSSEPGEAELKNGGGSVVDQGDVAQSEAGPVDVLVDASAKGAETIVDTETHAPVVLTDGMVTATASGASSSEPTAALQTTEPASFIKFFVNGHDCGIAYQDLEQQGPFFATASMYMGGTVRFIGGPKFKHPPPGYPGTVRGLFQAIQAEEAATPSAPSIPPNS